MILSFTDKNRLKIKNAMNLRMITLSVCCLFLTTFTGTAQTKISILGDSYSTFKGYVYPDYNAVWYGNTVKEEDQKQNDVSDVDQTWWRLLIKKMGAELIYNNSYSGATICHTGYKQRDCSERSYVTRMQNLGDPDIILIFGGTNDDWAQAPIGEVKYEKWTHKDLFKFRPAFCYLLHQMKELYPEARICNITNCDMRDVISKSMDEICKHYGILNIQLKDIKKKAGHPSIEGMQMICDQVYEKLK